MRFHIFTAPPGRLRGASLALALLALLGPLATAPIPAVAAPAAGQATVLSDEALAHSLLGGFVSASMKVNGVRLHYVIGGQGEPLILLPGWPETWWEFHKIMPQLAKTHRVIAVDLRGMGGSDKPRGGYDKKTMAADIQALASALRYDRVDIAGHDIGAMVAYAFAANYPAQTGCAHDRRTALREHPSCCVDRLNLRTRRWNRQRRPRAVPGRP